MNLHLCFHPPPLLLTFPTFKSKENSSFSFLMSTILLSCSPQFWRSTLAVFFAIRFQTVTPTDVLCHCACFPLTLYILHSLPFFMTLLPVGLLSLTPPTVTHKSSGYLFPLCATDGSQIPTPSTEFSLSFVCPLPSHSFLLF